MISVAAPDAPMAQCGGGGGTAPRSSGGGSDNLAEAMGRMKLHEIGPGEGTDDNRRPQNQYPYRPGVPDCFNYQRTGRCHFGNNCKYNHPNTISEYQYDFPQRVGQPDCQYFLKTGRCKYGAACKFHHPKDRQGSWPKTNILGLPMREDEMACPYYMKNGSCKYGILCKFHHPQPATSGAVYPPSGRSSYEYAGLSVVPSNTQPLIGSVPPAWHLSRFPYMSSSYLQGCIPFNIPPQGSMQFQHGWSTYMGPAMCQVSSYDYPERPEQPGCQYYLKTGSCTYGAYCKFDHPKGMNNYLYNSHGRHGFPSRPGQAVCMHYSTYGICMYGSDCKFDHPVVGRYNYTIYAPPRTNTFASFPQNRISRVVVSKPAETSPSKASDHSDHHIKYGDSTNTPTCSLSNHHDDSSLAINEPCSESNDCDDSSSAKNEPTCSESNDGDDSLAKTPDMQASSDTPMNNSCPEDHSN